MASKVSVPDRNARRTAITVINMGVIRLLCPFFGRCDGILLIDPRLEADEYHPNPDRTAAALCELIVRTLPERLVCGFVPPPEREKLRASGIDIRLGTCYNSIDELTARFYELPKA